MVDEDLAYVQRLLAAGVVKGRVLELGTGYAGATCRRVVGAAGLEYLGTDLAAGPGVDVPADFESPADMDRFTPHRPFGTVLILNVLEHTFDPIRVLDNARTLVQPGGHLVVLTPTVWPLHNYPMDAWRLMPNFYEEYSRRRGLHLADEHFEYVGRGPVRDHRNPDGTYRLPRPPRWHWSGRAVHRLFNTFGRGMEAPTHVATAAALRVP